MCCTFMFYACKGNINLYLRDLLLALTVKWVLTVFGLPYFEAVWDGPSPPPFESMSESLFWDKERLYLVNIKKSHLQVRQN
jgi:hypothetical protein